jgi:hypothetical protein
VGAVEGPDFGARPGGGGRQQTQCTKQRMRILLQQKDTGLYFKDIDSWVRTSADAMDFVSSTAAIEFCVGNKISDVHLVLKFEEQQYDIVLPVQPGRNYVGERPSDAT